MTPFLNEFEIITVSQNTYSKFITVMFSANLDMNVLLRMYTLEITIQVRSELRQHSKFEKVF